MTQFHIEGKQRQGEKVTFIEFLKIKKAIDPEEHDIDELMAEHYDEYTEFLMTLKEGCSQDEMA